MGADGGRLRSADIPVQADGILSTGRLSKVHQAPSREVIRTFQLICDMNRAELEVAQKFSLEELADIVADLARPRTVGGWADACNNIALQFKNDLLFSGPFPESREMDFEEFTFRAAPYLIQNPKITIAMFQFFQSIWKKMASENAN